MPRIGKIVGVRYDGRDAILDPDTGIWHPAKTVPFTTYALIALAVGVALVGLCIAAEMAAFVVAYVVLWL